MSTEADKPTPAAVLDERIKNKIQVSTKRSIFLYVNLAKRLLAEGEPEVELSGLGLAINAVVSCAEILKNQKLVIVKKIATSMSEVQNAQNQRQATVPKLQVFVTKSEQFEEVYATQQANKDAAKAEAAESETVAKE
eukprot:NODE_504_length_845_cov_90.989950_g444_i0.p1 GENE.NODE_504_length_845_cov_90.989950_g444_i0~~NODE_504_length_845_cov_90.989950_g444_i0.p1  ORF type:complete len:137 (+),score=39.35 NODE_504_length_845_cov_90.989950_g444_i0:97-507(+)